jgi:hypothetical protein
MNSLLNSQHLLNMDLQTEPFVFQEDIMISVHLSNGSFEVNQELIPTVKLAANALGMINVEDLKAISEEDFFATFTPLLNAHYGLR